jgi:hypothetical protein
MSRPPVLPPARHGPAVSRLPLVLIPLPFAPGPSKPVLSPGEGANTNCGKAKAH